VSAKPFALELRVAEQVAFEAGQLVRRYHGTKLKIDAKAGNEPVTEADHAASEFIVSRLRAAFPGDVVLSEEIPDDGSRLGRSRVWMVDPIDGTSDFIAGDTGFVVMIGLVVDGRPQVGAVAHPLTQHVYSGVVGQGAYLKVPVRGKFSLRTSTIARPPGIRLVASKTHRTARVDAVKQALGVTDELNVGSVGLKIGLVSEGSRDLYVYTGGRTKIWDSCGPEAILLGAGGKVTDLDGKPLVYDKAELYNRRGIVASNGPLHDYVIGALAPIVGATD
jgi:3'(2'), 5'-bisphosphate nucleotidase